jgi:hypothetical protein
MSVRLYLLLPLAITLASLHALPFVPRPDRLFGVAVPREIRCGNEGWQALRHYQLQLLPWTAAVLFVSLWLPLSWAVLWMEAAFLIPAHHCRLAILPAADRNSPFCLACTFHARSAIDECRRSFIPASSVVCDPPFEPGRNSTLPASPLESNPRSFSRTLGTKRDSRRLVHAEFCGCLWSVAFGSNHHPVPSGNTRSYLVGFAQKRAAPRRPDSSDCGCVCDRYGLFGGWTFAPSHCPRTEAGGFLHRVSQFPRRYDLALPSAPRGNWAGGRRNHA